MRILALQLKRIGDLALTTPALHALKSAGWHVTLVVAEGSAALLPMMQDNVDETLVYRGRGGGNGGLWKRIWRGSFDVCVDFTGRDRSALMTVASRAKVRLTGGALLRRGGWRRWCYNTVAEAPVRSRHTVDHYLDFLAPLGLVGVGDRVAGRIVAATGLVARQQDGTPFTSPVLRLTAEMQAKAAGVLASEGIGAGDEFFVVHPGSARTEKYWVPERWAEVIAFCQSESGQRCVLTGGQHDPCEQTHLAAIRAALAARGQTCVDLAGRLDLSTLAAVLARASLVVGVDSGPMHLAAAWERPQIVLFGPTNPFHWRPRHAGARVIRAGHGDLPLRGFAERSPGAAMDQISTRAVIDCIKQMPSSAAPAR